jgi:type IV pilus assembly protein PilC
MRHFAAMLTAGIEPSEALGILEEEKKQKAYKGWEYFTKHPIVKDPGDRSVFEKSPAWFKNLLAYTVACEKVEMEAARLMHHIADGQETLENLKKRAISALTYPVTVLVIAAVIIGAIMVFVIPTIVEMYASFSDSLPGPTQTLLVYSNFIVKNFIWILVAFILAIKLLGTKPIRDSILYLLSLTGIGLPITAYSNIMFSRTLSIMLYLKAPMEKALTASVEAVPNRFHAWKFKKALIELENSGSLSYALESTGLYSPSTIRIFKAGEACGSIESSLAEMSRYQEKIMVNQFDGMTKSLDMILLILMATVVGYIVIALYLPIFEMGSVVG